MSLVGLSQGYAFGPIGYAIYTLSAGDIARYTHITFDPKKASSLDEALKALPSRVADINTWMTHNRLKLNEEKPLFPWNVTLYIGSITIVHSKSARKLDA